MKIIRLLSGFIFALSAIAQEEAVPAEAVTARDVVPEDVVAAGVPAHPAAPAGSEYIVICGGPALRTWERSKKHPHDNTWANFVTASEIRWKQIKPKVKAGDVLTWLVYKPGYERRSKEDGENRVSSIENRARTLGVNIKWFGPSQEVIDHINGAYPRDSVKIANLEFFGHSNRNCWMFDYSNGVDGCSYSFLHNKDLPQLKADSFVQTAYVKSWGCHSAEAFCREWKRYTGTTMIGTTGKTDYSTGGLPKVTRAPGWSYQ
jgi:hypothetical protein